MARIFNTYGPRMHPNDGRVVSNFIVQALKGEDITIYGDGMQTRSFCYVDDLIDGWLRLMDHTPDDFTGPVNLGNPVEMPVKQLAERDRQARRRQVEARAYRPLPVDDPLQRCPDITLARKELQWEPKVDLETGLEKTIEYFDTLLKSNKERRAASAVEAMPLKRKGARARPLFLRVASLTGRRAPACGRALTTETLPEVISSWIHL